MQLTNYVMFFFIFPEGHPYNDRKLHQVSGFRFFNYYIKKNEKPGRHIDCNESILRCTPYTKYT